MWFANFVILKEFSFIGKKKNFLMLVKMSVAY